MNRDIVVSEFCAMARQAGENPTQTAARLARMFPEASVYNVTGAHAVVVYVRDTDEEAFKIAHDTVDDDSAVIRKYLPLFETWAGWDVERQNWYCLNG